MAMKSKSGGLTGPKTNMKTVAKVAAGKVDSGSGSKKK